MKDQRTSRNCVCVFLISLSLVSVVWCQTERTMLRKLVGKTAIFNCPYESVYRDSPKYLQKKEYNVTLVRSDGQKASTTVGRCILYDKKNSSRFDVHILHLTLNDTGTYVCGVEAGGGRDQQETELEVYDETGQTTVRYYSITSLFNRTTTTSTTTATSPFITKLLAPVLAAPVLVLIGIVIVCIRMRRKTRRSTERSPAPRTSNDISLTSNERAILQDNIYAQDTPSTRPLSSSDLMQPSSISNPPASHSSLILYPPVANQRPAQINTDSHIPVYSLLTLPDEAS
ncbi:uncharacterized protein LOC125298464 [Alosa alosa]|uniref:uncharacterized protein LOC125298464 n=1 Tax=Alosa alosa TaxID=278164 RepID=UPI0020151643|nr:uncharacterized protein LOC125298464 [Alosa alosa]